MRKKRSLPIHLDIPVPSVDALETSAKETVHQNGGIKSEIPISLPEAKRKTRQRGKRQSNEDMPPMKTSQTKTVSGVESRINIEENYPAMHITREQPFVREYEIEMDLDEPLANLIRLLQPGLNFDLSAASIILCKVKEVSATMCLKDCVRDGSRGMVKVKLSVNRVPDQRPVITLEDILQATDVIAPEEPSARQASSFGSPNPSSPYGSHSRSSPSVSEKPSDSDDKAEKNKKSGSKRSSKKKPVLEQNFEWIPSVSFQTLRNSIGMPEDIYTWTKADVAQWLMWASSTFALPDVNMRLFSELDGQGLQTLSRPMFRQLVGKDDHDLFWTHFDFLRNSHQAAVPITRTPAPTADLSTNGNGIKQNGTSKVFPSGRIFTKESSGTIQLWQFLLELLADKAHTDKLEWTGSEAEFRLLEPEKVAELWGQCKNKANMNYEKMSRALRYYYDGKILAKVPGKHFTYKFVCDLKEHTGVSLGEMHTQSDKESCDEPLDLSPRASSNSNPSSPATPLAPVEPPRALAPSTRKRKRPSAAAAADNVRKRRGSVNGHSSAQTAA